jgi:hypothetical protein
MNNQKTKNSKTATSTTNPNKLSNTPFIVLIIAAFAMIIYRWYQYHKEIKSTDGFENQLTTGKVPYIAQNAYINIYATPSDYPKFQWLFKASLPHSILITNGTDRVMVPKTVKNIPINVFTNSDKTYFTLTANDIEQIIKPCNFIATTF